MLGRPAGPEELDRLLPPSIHDRALQLLREPARHGDEPRPKLESHREYIFGVFLVPVAAADDQVFYQQIDVALTLKTLLTVRKTPQGREAYDPAPAPAAFGDGASPAKALCQLVDDIAERYLNPIDTLDEEIDELETTSRSGRPAGSASAPPSSGTTSCTSAARWHRPATRRAVVDNRVDLAEGQLFTHELELSFGDAYDKLLRATEGLELSRDLLSSVRNYQQSKIANDQNEVMKRLTAIASILLLPTLIVGIYGQNFRRIPELHWASATRGRGG